MRRIFANIILLIAPIAIYAQNVKSVNFRSGDGEKISDFLSEEEMLNVDSLILRGWLYNSEIVHSEIRHMCQDGKLRGLDMSAVYEPRIPDSAFKPSDSEKEMPLRYITLPNLFFIGDEAFENTAIREVFISGFVEGIGKDAFKNCKDLRKVTVRSPFVPLNVMQDNPFEGLPENAALYVPEGARDTYANDPRWNSFSEIHEKEGLFVTKHVDLSRGSLMEELGSDWNNIDSLVITGTLSRNEQNSLSTIYSAGKFRSFNLSDAACEDNVLDLGYSSGSGYPHLRYLRLPEGLEKILYIAQDAYLYDFHFPSTLKSIDECSFQYATVHGEIHIPEGVTYLGFAAFRGLECAPNMYVPSTLEYYDYGSFQITSKDKGWNLYVNRLTPPVYVYTGGYPFGKKLYENCTLYVPIGAADAYKNDKYWSWFQNIVETPELDGGQSSGIKAAVTESDGSGKPTAIYSLDGTYLGTSESKLPHGIYIVGGKKVVR